MLRNDARPAQPKDDTLLLMRTFLLNAGFISPKPVTVSSMLPETSPDSGIIAIVNLLPLLRAPLWSMLTRGIRAPKKPVTVIAESVDIVRPAMMNAILNLPRVARIGTTNIADVFEIILQFPLVFPNKMRHVAFRIKFAPDTAITSPR